MLIDKARLHCPSTLALSSSPSRSLVNPASRQAVAFSPSVDLGLTDIEMANGLDYDDQYIDEMEYEVRQLLFSYPLSRFIFRPQNHTLLRFLSDGE